MNMAFKWKLQNNEYIRGFFQYLKIKINLKKTLSKILLTIVNIHIIEVYIYIYEVNIYTYIIPI